MASESTHIEDGIEWSEPVRGDEAPYWWCARCGSSCDWEDCENCVDGYSGHECGEDTCACRYPEDNVMCDWCYGTGGWWRCGSSREYCEANPLPGREHIESTARRKGEP
jgi:hypothetical protein